MYPTYIRFLRRYVSENLKPRNNFMELFFRVFRGYVLHLRISAHIC